MPPANNRRKPTNPNSRKPGSFRTAGSQGAANKGAGNKSSVGKSGAPRGAGKDGAAANKGRVRNAQTTRRGQNQHANRPFKAERYGANLGPVVQPAPTPKRSFVDVHNPDGIRLQKVMAQAGVASRRLCEEMITEGRVEVDGQIVTELGLRVDPQKAEISVDGIRLQLKENMIYLAFNKPRGVVSTMDDPEGRRNISDFLKQKYAHERLFHVGRLDANTEGLLLLTNDGELANRLTHPSYEVTKTYLVQTRGPMAPGVGKAMRAGIELEDGVTAVDSFKLVDSTPGHVLVEVELHSGKNRIVRRLFSAVDYPVERLVRLKVGPISVGDQKQGTIRPLSNHEIGHLLASVGL